MRSPACDRRGARHPLHWLPAGRRAGFVHRGASRARCGSCATPCGSLWSTPPEGASPDEVREHLLALRARPGRRHDPHASNVGSSSPILSAFHVVADALARRMRWRSSRISRMCAPTSPSPSSTLFIQMESLRAREGPPAPCRQLPEPRTHGNMRRHPLTDRTAWRCPGRMTSLSSASPRRHPPRLALACPCRPHCGRLVRPAPSPRPASRR